MGAYILRRLLLVIPTLLGILLINFALIQFVPGGPVEQALVKLENEASALDRIGGGGAETASTYEGSQGLPPEFIEELKVQYGLDKPVHVRFWIMLKNYATFDMGESYFKSGTVVELIIDKLPVSITLGLWSTLLAYLISIPLGIRKAVRDGSAFDTWTSGIIIATYAIPSFLFGILLIVLFAGGSYWQIFPLRGLTSRGFDDMTTLQQIMDYLWHIALPVLAVSIGGFAQLTLLTKNSFLDEISKQYVYTARAKGLTERRVLYGHVFRNAMLIIIAGIPGVFTAVLFGQSLIIEVVFSLDGLGLLGFEAIVERDYPVFLGILYLLSFLGLLIKIISDLTYVWVDPRIDFGTRNT